ncbi:MBL fold metallo-hydrolase [Pandoraea commovens]|uniref:MBL fold metallo-hydrolase n=1 Tax=Pandoraea commovens TaxID=2508289 RepID=A0A5E4UN69_9BURK|nr:MBL fold metallo-hydrolase [Pandoraea commovens]UVA78400.1 MBL fold metallo-hydrolase [Pandoraea commovens]VVE01402.1 Ribonuclease Z [Pandoraea commovens]
MQKMLRKCGVILALLSAIGSTSASAETMRVTLLGTGTPILNINRFGISVLVEAGTQKLLFDAGRGVAMRLHQRQVPLRDISAVFISLLNSDHITGLPDLYATAPLPTDDGRLKTPMTLFGPDGIDNVARGIELMFKDQNRMRMLEGEVVEPATHIHAKRVEPGIVYEKDGVKVSAFLIEHGHVKPDFGYRIEYGGHAVVITDDTTYSENLVAHSKHADLMVQSVAIGSRALERAAPDYVNHFYGYLASPESAGRILSEAQPKLAVFAHISLYSRPDIPRATVDELRERVQAAYRGNFVIGEDLMTFDINDHGVTQAPYSPEVRQQEPRT